MTILHRLHVCKMDIQSACRGKVPYPLTIAGLLFVGKETAINRLLPQAEVIYLHYSADNMEEYDSRLDLKQPIISVIDRLTEKIQNTNKIVNVQVGLFRLEVEDFSEKVFQEALLNALSHRDYLNMGAVYVKHYPDRIVIENPGAFPEGVNEKNIITHPSTPRNKLIAETLQRLKYVQRTGQGVDIIFLEHHFQSFIEFPIVGKSPFHAVSWHSKMCFVPLRTSSFWGFKQPINTKVPAILYLCGNPGVFCACAA